MAVKVVQSAYSPMFIKAKNDNIHNNCFVNINNIASIEKTNTNHWKAVSINGRDKSGSREIYYFDDNSASKIINYTA